MCQIGPSSSIFFYQRAGLVVSEAQPGVPSDMAIVAILILYTCRPRPPCCNHRFPVPFSRGPRGVRSICFYTGGSAHQCPALFGELQHQKPLKRLVIAVSPLPGIFAFDESAALYIIYNPTH